VPAVADAPWSDEDLERIRSSTVMLAPHSPGAPNRETAITMLTELQELRRSLRRLLAIIDEIQAGARL